MVSHLLTDSRYPTEPPPVEKFYTPFGSKVALTVFKAADSSVGGVVLPDGSQTKHESALGRVVAVGPECKQVKAGDVVVLHLQTNGKNVVLGGKKLTQIQEEDVVGIIDDPSTLPGVHKSA